MSDEYLTLLSKVNDLAKEGKKGLGKIVAFKYVEMKLREENRVITHEGAQMYVSHVRNGKKISWYILLTMYEELKVIENMRAEAMEKINRGKHGA
jgi:hypothetical protein